MEGNRSDSFVSLQRYVSGFCEHGNEILGFIKCGEFTYWVRNCQLLKKDCAVLQEVSHAPEMLRYAFISKPVARDGGS